jgi:hypothetical protein
MATAAAAGHHDAEQGEVVGGDAGALELGAHGLQRALGFGPEAAVEHGGLLGGPKDCLQKLALHAACVKGTHQWAVGERRVASAGVEGAVEVAPVLGVVLGEGGDDLAVDAVDQHRAPRVGGFSAE